MIVNICFGTRDLARAGAFYDKLFAEAGAARTGETERSIYYGSAGQGAGFAVTLPFDGNPATNGNGTMATLGVADRPTVDRMHAAALANGGTCEGAPGERANGFYVAYWRDPDGNKMNAVAMG
ncbi:VOC family protein [Novosphingobium sp. TH158]|uniref:VOC family protein n=1 Tax=Novosphingobium sp. TH158 TaxID=2067455 RepID=UPI000C7CE322|nr:VOC family protein [Novosphingobium sp. TH158]PLK27332.1 glyoxalase [Novosphingobium sp. TH158]